LRQKTSDEEEEENLRSSWKKTGNGDKSRKLTTFFASRFGFAATMLHMDNRKTVITNER
jgi:hypothetical protein